MRFTVSQSALLNALSIVGKGIASNSTLPLLSGIYIKAENGTLELQTTDLTISIRHKLTANIEEEGETVLSGKLLQNIVKNLSDAAVTFESQDASVYITCEKSHYLLNALDPMDFPEFPQFAVEKSVELPRDVLGTMVDKVYRVTSKDTSRPILSGVLLTVEDNVVRLVATDSYRLAVCDTNVETSGLEGVFEAIVSGTVFHDVLSLPSETSSIMIGKTDSQVVFVFGNTTYVSRRIEGNYPNYKQILPSSCNTTVKINVDEFSAALKRVSVIAVNNPSVKMDIDADAAILKLSTTSQDQGEASESIACEVEGDSVVTGLNYHYVFDCVNAQSQEKEMILELKDGRSPGIFKSFSKINYLYLLMPVRM